MTNKGKLFLNHYASKDGLFGRFAIIRVIRVQGFTPLEMGLFVEFVVIRIIRVKGFTPYGFSVNFFIEREKWKRSSSGELRFTI
jgi:hypothetical protein